MYQQMELTMAEDEDGLPIQAPVINDLCPSVKPLSVADYLKSRRSDERFNIDSLCGLLQLHFCVTR